MLTAYLSQVERLLQNPAATPALYSVADLTYYINVARGQVAIETKCVRANITVSTVNGTMQYPLANITPGGSGFGPIVNVQSASYASGSGYVYLNPRKWDYFNTFLMCQPSILTGAPVDWSQYGVGENGVIYLSPIPGGVYSVILDAVCAPIPLVTDGTAEAIPYPYTDAVPFFAAYFAYLSAQRTADAASMAQQYQEFIGRAAMASETRRPNSPYPSLRNQHPQQGQ